jgi:hypothetical protein
MLLAKRIGSDRAEALFGRLQHIENETSLDWLNM